MSDRLGIRFLLFRNFLSEKRIENSFEVIFFEEVRGHRGLDAAHIYGGFIAILTSWCEKYRIEYCGLPVKTIKKNITGTGNANKDEVIQVLRKKGFYPRDSNEADAIALLLSASKFQRKRREKNYFFHEDKFITKC